MNTLSSIPLDALLSGKVGALSMGVFVTLLGTIELIEGKSSIVRTLILSALGWIVFIALICVIALFAVGAVI